MLLESVNVLEPLEPFMCNSNLTCEKYGSVAVGAEVG